MLNTGPEAVPAFPGYIVLEKLGEGGMGTVYKARDPLEGRVVALKTLRDWRGGDESDRERFLREARAASGLDHPGIVRVLALYDAQDPPFFVMEYVVGVPLKDRMRLLAPAEAARAIAKVARAIDYAHAQGVVHRDLKPSNILFGGDGEPRILDFGVAGFLDAAQTRLTRVGEFLGTPAYAAPEQFEPGARIGPETDVYALGAILYELLAGRPPFEGANLREIVGRILQGDPPLPRNLAPGVPEPLQRVCLKAIEKNPAKRYATAADLAEDLERFLDGEEVSARPAIYDAALSAKAVPHLDEIARWHGERLISRRERDRLERAYRGILTDEPEWLGTLRHVKPAQVFLYLGGLLILLGCGMWMAYHWRLLLSLERIAGSLGPCVLLQLIGAYLWKRKRFGAAVAFLLVGGSLVAPAVAVFLSQVKWPAGSQGAAFEILPTYFTNVQMLIASVLGLAWGILEFRWCRASAFSYLIAAALLATYVMMQYVLGFRAVEKEATRALLFLPLAAVMAGMGGICERWNRPKMAPPFYAAGLLTLFATVAAIAFFAPIDWLEAPWGDVRRLQKLGFLGAAAVWLPLALVADRWGTETVRFFAFFLFLAVPPSILVPLHLLEHDGPLLYAQVRWAEALLPAASLAVALSSIPLQLRTFLYTGFLYLSISVQRITENHFPHNQTWPVSLMVAGLTLMLLTLLAERIRRKYLGRTSALSDETLKA